MLFLSYNKLLCLFFCLSGGPEVEGSIFSQAKWGKIHFTNIYLAPGTFQIVPGARVTANAEPQSLPGGDHSQWGR